MTDPAVAVRTDSGSTVGSVGFVGLGNMGSAMALRLAAAGFAVTGFDVATERARAVGVRLADSAAGVAAGADVVVLMLPDSDAVESVLVGGLLDALEPGCVLVDMGSSEPARTRALAERVTAAGCSMLDAPVSGGVSGAVAGRLTIMVGGDAGRLERLRPVFEVLGARVIHAGEVGAGHAVKALNNLLSATHLLAGAEAMAAAARFGMAPAVFLEIVNGSSGRSASTENKLPGFVLTGGYDSGFGLRLMLKDMRIALGLARDGGAGHELGAAAVLAWERASDALPASADHTEIARWVEEGT